MDSDSRPQRALNIATLLHPLLRLLLRHSVSFGAFEDQPKRTYVEVARLTASAFREAIDFTRIDPVGVDAQGSAIAYPRRQLAMLDSSSTPIDPNRPRPTTPHDRLTHVTHLACTPPAWARPT